MAEIVINTHFAIEMYTLVYLLTGAQIAGCFWIKTPENMYRRSIRMMRLHTLGRWWTGKRQASRMNELLKINYDADLPTVSARDLHERLNIESNFTT